ncbi:MAG: LEA type 2 family protein [Ignavibacteriae bacterium]|nr:LEA type 2 family protein [Ignavibacteriota bacterium]
MNLLRNYLGVFQRTALLSLCIALSFSLQSCPSVLNALNNLQRLQFKLENVSNFRVAGIQIDNKSKLSDFSISDGLSLSRAVATNRFPATFTINVAAINPNDGKGTAPQRTATLSSLDFQLIIDDLPTIKGDISQPLDIPGNGQTTMVPVTVSMDLYEYFGNKGYDGLVNLALVLGGAKGSTSHIKLDARPTVSTAIGNIAYPGRIIIVDKQFSN